MADQHQLRNVVGDIIDALILNATRLLRIDTPATSPDAATTEPQESDGAEAEAVEVDDAETTTSTDAPSASESRTEEDAEDRWRILEANLEEARALRHAANAREERVWRELDEFLEAHGTKGHELAGSYPHLVSKAKGIRQAGFEWLAERRRMEAARREAEEMERNAREVLERFRLETESKDRELQDRINEAAYRRRRDAAEAEPHC